MKVLVTVGAGFIGSHLCEKLAQDDDNKVFSLDGYSTGTKDNHVDKVIYIEGSSNNIEKLVNFIPDIIYHLGEYSRVEQSFDDIEKVWDSNKNGIFQYYSFVERLRQKLCMLVVVQNLGMEV